MKRKKIVKVIFVILFYWLSIPLSKPDDKPKKTYVEGLFEFFKKGKVIELTEFPKTKVFENFLADEALHKGMSIEELKERIKKRGITSYLLELLRNGHISPVEFANLMNISWIQAFQMAYSSGALKLSEESLEILMGKETDTIKQLRNDKEIVVKTIAYKSTLDELYPLYAEIAYNPKHRKMPVVVYQHGDYPGTRLSTVPGIYNLAKKGIFGISVSKRGRDGSAGRGDVFCKEIYDIYDAVEYVKRNYSKYIDPENINITGASGGGMDTFSAIVHFPDYFRVAAPFVAPPDLDHWFRQIEPAIKLLENLAKIGGRYEGSWSLLSNMISDIGGLPSEIPDKYLARNWVLGAINNPYTLIHIFWDAEDGAAPSITERSNAYFEETKKLGFTNVHLHFSQRGDKIRFLHWGVPDNIFVWHYFLPPIMSKSHPAPLLSDAGRLVVLGYIKTKRFFIWLGEGDNAVAKVDYLLDSKVSTFNFRRLSKDPSKKGILTFENPEKDNYQVIVNEKVLIERTDSEHISVQFRLDDKVILKKIK